jgi:hypothetical protein
MAAQAVSFALAQRGKPYKWGANGPNAYDCSGLMWAAWRSAGVSIPRTAANQLAHLPRAKGKLKAGDLVIYATNGPSRRHVAMVVASGRMVEARGKGIPVRVTALRKGWLGVVRPISPIMLASGFAKHTIPGRYLALYQKAGNGEVWKTKDGRRYAAWAVLAGIGRVESNHGRSRLPGVRSGANPWGACGPMQIGCVSGSKAGNSWARYGKGRPYNPGNAIPAARRYLLANGARRNVYGAVWNYNHADWYVRGVLNRARHYQKGA